MIAYMVGHLIVEENGIRSFDTIFGAGRGVDTRFELIGWWVNPRVFFIESNTGGWCSGIFCMDKMRFSWFGSETV